jgi:hypothetical protein
MDSLKAGVAVQGRLDDRVPVFMEGSERRVSASVMYEGMKNLGLIFEGSGFLSMEDPNLGTFWKIRLVNPDKNPNSQSFPRFQTKEAPWWDWWNRE